MAAIKVLGVNDDTDTCECCGRTGLKRVVWLERLDTDGNGASGPFAAGVDCAARLLRTTATRIKAAAIAADRERETEERTRIHEVGEVRSVRAWVIESVSSQGECFTLCFANGLRPLVAKWAEDRFPNKCIDVRLAR